jgi:hypothetical protein
VRVVASHSLPTSTEDPQSAPFSGPNLPLNVGLDLVEPVAAPLEEVGELGIGNGRLGTRTRRRGLFWPGRGQVVLGKACGPRPGSSLSSRYSGSTQLPKSMKNSPLGPKCPTIRTVSTTPPPALTMFRNAVKVPWAVPC